MKAVLLSLLTLAAAVSPAVVVPCRIRVVEKESGWPVPLVQLVTVNGIRFVTDNAGVVAMGEPDLMDREVWFSVEGQGYGVPKDGFGNAGVRLTPRTGATRTIEVTRNVRARRLGRIGGSGLFAESEKCGDPPRGAESGEVGRDSVQCQPYGDGLFWLWGDTSLANYPLGVFNVTAARTPNPAFPRPEPPVDPGYRGFLDARGRPRGVMPPQGKGPVWIFGLVNVRDRAGAEHLGGVWSQIRGFCQPYRIGLCEWNPEKERFAVLDTIWNEASGAPRPERVPDVNHVRWTDPEGKRWILFGAPYPRLRIPDSYEAWRDTNDWETVHCPERRIAKRGGGHVESRGGQVVWSACRGKWVSLFHVPLDFGAVWYAEADAPTGPWRNAVKVLDHDNYTFYNVVIHAEYGPDAPYLVFEGTYTRLFAQKPVPTARYDYTQVLYRLDFADLDRKFPAR